MSIFYIDMAMNEIEEFNGRNDFRLWRENVKALLDSQGLLNTLQGKEALSDELSDGEKERLMNKALSVIQLSLADEILLKFVNETCPAKLWIRLEDLYMKKFPRSRLHLKICLYTLRMAEGSSIKNHLDEFDEIICGLKNIGVEVEDEDQALLLLLSLPPSYGHFVKTLLSRSSSVSVDIVKAALRRRSRKGGEMNSREPFNYPCKR